MCFHNILYCSQPFSILFCHLLYFIYLYIYIYLSNKQLNQSESTIPTQTKHPFVDLSALPIFSGVRVRLSLVFCVMFCKWMFCPFFLLLVIVLSVLLGLMASNHPCVIFKPLLKRFLSYVIV